MDELLYITDRPAGDVRTPADAAVATICAAGRGAWIGVDAPAPRLWRDGLCQPLPDAAAFSAEAWQGHRRFVRDALSPVLQSDLGALRFGWSWWDGHRRVCAALAQHLRRLAGPRSVLWFGDHRLLACIPALRAAGVSNRIAMSIPAPWPAPDLLAVMPAAPQVMAALMQCDLLGFAQRRHRRNFQAGTEGIELPPQDVRRQPRLELCPPLLPEVDPARQDSAGTRVRRSSGRILLRGDAGSAIAACLRAYDLFLAQAAELHGRVSLLLATPTGGCDDEVAGLCSRINGEHGSYAWTPLHHVRAAGHRLPRNVLRHTRVFVHAARGDQEDTVPQQFLAAQNAADPGVLLVAAQSCTQDLLPQLPSFRPLDTVGLAQALARAFHLPAAERVMLWQSCQASLAQLRGQDGMRGFLDPLRVEEERPAVPALAAE